MNLKYSLIILATISALLIFSFNKYRTTKHDREHQQIILSSYVFKDQPQQQKTKAEPFIFKGFTITPMATFLIRARILSRQSYSSDFEAKLSPIDLALGWKRMADPAVYEKLNISQSGRWYRYSWAAQPPIPPQEIIESSGNMHMIPESQSVEDILHQAKKGDFIKIKGLLVKIAHNSGWRWESSLSRKDTGAGSCEVVFVTETEIE